MKITWLGHSCFMLEFNGYRLVTDPYKGVPGYPPLRIEAHAVYASHSHFDHTETAAVTILPAMPSPFTVQEMETFHDTQQGALRGMNTVRVFTAEGLQVVHLGDLGHPLSRSQADALLLCDVLMVPVGGVYTIGAAEAEALCRRLRPRVILPMHYRHGAFGLREVESPAAFCRRVADDYPLCTLAGNSLEVGKDAPQQTILLTYPA